MELKFTSGCLLGVLFLVAAGFAFAPEAILLLPERPALGLAAGGMLLASALVESSLRPVRR